MEPSIPEQSSRVALACLRAVQASGLGEHISIGGAFRLAHFCEYRTTKDVDALWSTNCTEEIRKKIISVLQKTMQRFGVVKIRKFGEVVSPDLLEDNKLAFNFQIAKRGVRLRPGASSPWHPVQLDALEDLVASKMTALVVRGLPRDFVDIFEMCQRGICSKQKCWSLRHEREQKRGAKPDMNLALQAILLHLRRIEKMRPLESIRDDATQQRAREVRNWFKHEFCKPNK